MGAWDGGSTRAWRKVRARVLARDSYLCQLRLDVCTTTATCVHHTQGRAATGDNPRYLVASCRECNAQVGDPTRHDPAPKQVTKW